ncbi:vancomycin permeability regulator SanA [Chryseobacterium ginsenosidimutans]|uniref:YdcF family protein n=1 Tax=Chryseobacterium ginsenosidimutans TaxID=687846 RepID=UPI0027833448|nr:YdcF family protein [Chryseobacterium ginsenosidimutans]MDQ0594683.1 vancomycin permeability regulator SanA [Chryseobacterium ginsenosidimutans]
MTKKLFKICKVIASIFVAWFIIHSLYIVIDGVYDQKKSGDLAVILGSKVNENGTLSKRLEKRLESGIELYRNHRIKRILVSGGLGKEGFYEGDKMREFLLLKGIPDSLIIIDNHGDNTRATVENTLQLRSKLNFNSIIVVSQYFHVTRTKKLFKDQGFENVTSVSPDYFEWRDLYSILREFPAYYLK